MSLLEQVLQDDTDAEQPVTKVVPTGETDPYKPRFMIHSVGGKRSRPYDKRLFVHAVDRVKNFIYFGVDQRLADEATPQLSHSEMIGILDNPISEEFFMACCIQNLPLQEAGINNRRKLFASPSGELSQAPTSKDSYPVMEVRFISYI